MPAWQDAGAARGKRACRHCLLPAVARETISQVAEETFETREPRIFYGVIIVVTMLDVGPVIVFSMMPVPAPSLGMVGLSHKKAYLL